MRWGPECCCTAEPEPPVEPIQTNCFSEAPDEEEKEDTECSSIHLSALKKEPEITLIAEEELVRGVSIHATLHGAGSLWRKSPCDMSEAEKVGLWEKSRRVDEFDMFLSHAWASSGKVKFLTLLLFTGGGYSFLFWAAAMLSASWLYMLDALPMPFVLPVDMPEFSGDCPVGVWMLIFGFIAQLAGLALSPYLPHRRCDCFLDVVSINQHDPVQMQRGIYALGGFLSRSKELRILWSPPLFTRLWCIFELAAYRAANPSGEIRLMPHYFVVVAFLALFLDLVLAMALLGLRTVESGDESWAHFLFMFLIVLGAVHLGRRVSLQKQRLIEQLESFTLDGAGCRLESDRDFIYEAVKQWYGGLDQFTDFVRGPLRGQLLRCCSQIPADLLLVMSLPLVAYKAEFLLAMWKGGVPGNILMAYFCSSILGFGLWTAFITSVGLYTVDFFAKPTRSGLLLDFCQSLAIAALTSGTYFSGYVLDMQARQGHAEMIVLWVTLACLSVAWFCWAVRDGWLIAPFIGLPFQCKPPTPE
ncbi:unnamed protein product [Effrenium voratum]|uniref:Uncharacterized protein n=1 Tax=Effrenium voratum TaxID=2562239 RepID=A0AA36IMN8_9DINO|nr:unnamed protein product [Effrenium voratum]